MPFLFQNFGATVCHHRKEPVVFVPGSEKNRFTAVDYCRVFTVLMSHVVQLLSAPPSPANSPRFPSRLVRAAISPSYCCSDLVVVADSQLTMADHTDVHVRIRMDQQYSGCMACPGDF